MKNPVSFKRNIKVGNIFNKCHKPILISVRGNNPLVPHLPLVAFRYIQSTVNENGVRFDWNKQEQTIILPIT